MCNVCCKEFKGWCKSFTKLEASLSLIQLIFLIIFIAILTFLILHFLACRKHQEKLLEEHVTTDLYGTTYTDGKKITYPETHSPMTTPLPESVKCTWDPSQKTIAMTHYYESTQTETSTKATVSQENFLGGEIINEKVEFLIALVKYKPPQHIAFGCTLTIISTKWTLTAATCIEAIEELDSLDSFVMMEGLGTGNPGKFHAISDVMIHPQYEGANKNYDLAAIKSEGDIVLKERKLIALASLIDFMSITIGEKMQLYGFGRFRSVDKDPLTRKIHSVQVHKLPSKHCPSTNNTWSPRHLLRGQAIFHGSCGKAPICAGVLDNLRTPCNYCAGAPLVYRGLLLGLMSDNPNCGISCDPVLYVNIAAVRYWVDSVVNSD